jgi:hypothetical protein
MRYTQPALSLVEQADLLIYRGMLGDREQIIRQLSADNYYRLSGYWHTFRLPNSHDFSPKTTFGEVWLRYLSFAPNWKSNPIGWSRRNLVCRVKETMREILKEKDSEQLSAQFVESAKLEQAINANLRGLDYGW